MASPRKIYKRTGLRRDKNFADLSDSKQALNNLLDTLVDVPDTTFISEDLDTIRTIFTTGITPGEYQQFIGSAVRQTATDGSTNAVTPAITYQNRLDNFRVTSGEPRLNGGNGLTAKYFNQDQIEDTSDIFVGDPIEIDTFWEAGQFDYTGKIHPQSVNAAGGVQWEGYFIPTQTGSYTFNTSSTLGFTVDFETEGYTSGVGTYTEYSRVGLTTSISGVSTTSGTDTVAIPLASVSNVGVGMTVTASSNNRIKLGSSVVSVGSTGIISLSDDDGDSVNSVGTTILSFGRTLGESSSRTLSTYVLERSRKYRIRYRVFVPPGTTSTRGILRSISFTYNRPGSLTSSYLRYNNLYSLDYDFSEEAKGNIIKFLDQSLLFGGNKEVGGERIGGSTQPEYVKVSTNKKVDIRYVPKESLTQIERKTISSASWSAGSKIITTGDTTNIEVGNYVFAATTGLTGNVNTPVRVVQIITNLFIVTDALSTGSGSGVALTFVDHRGFVKKVTASSSSGTMTISSGDTVGLKSKQIAIWDGSETYTGITTTGSSNQVLITPAETFDSRGPNSNNFTLSSSVSSSAINGVEWGSFLRTYGVWREPGNVQTLGQTYSTTYTLDIKSPGNYTLQYSGDDVGSITFDGTTVVSSFATDLFKTSATTTISNVTAGPHTIVASISNTSLTTQGFSSSFDNWNQNPAGIAWRLTRNNSVNSFSTRRVYFYESRGLIDTALAAFCPTSGVNATRCVLVTEAALAGSTVLTVSDTSDLTNTTIQGFPFADNTTITSVSGNTITISPGAQKNIAVDSNFTATLASEDKSLCCPPTDTSPPFNPTEEGLETILGGADNLKITGGNLIFDNLTATVNTSDIAALAPGSTNVSTKRISFKGGDGVTYELLCE